MKITINCSQTIGTLDHFWGSTGFTPARLLLQPDMRQALTYIGSLPRQGVTYVRIHYLLDLVSAQGLGTESPDYDWSLLDKGLDLLRENGLRPFFELMGNPSGYFDDFEDDRQLWAWRRLVRDLALHYQERYGREEVRNWYFETWNEPDASWWPYGIKGFMNYYDACSEGLKDADSKLRLGGPGTCRHLSEMLKCFLEHCDRGTNYFTGAQGVRLDFVSVHEKGARSCPEDLNPDSMGICRREQEIVNYIRENHPSLAAVPFMNNECDPQVGWSDVHTWRARPYYAAMVCKVINQHLNLLAQEAGCRYELLSNDNGFLGTWGYRTHLARLGDEKALAAGRFDQIKKPVHNVMALLALLGDRRLEFAGPKDPGSDLGVIATAHADEQVAILLYNSRDQIMSSGCEPVELELQGLPWRQAMLVHYRLDAQHGDPYNVWEKLGAPRRPSVSQLGEIRRAQEPAYLEKPREVSCDSGRLSLRFELLLPSVSLVLLAAKLGQGPGQVQGLRCQTYKGLNGDEQLMLVWDGFGSLLRTYEVLRATSPDGPYERLNEADLISSAFLYAPGDGEVDGYYRVRAVDFWGRVGAPSEVLHYSPLRGR